MRKIEILNKIQKEIDKETEYYFLNDMKHVYSAIDKFMDSEIDLTHKEYEFTKGDWIHKITFTEDTDMGKIYIDLKSESWKRDDPILAFVSIPM